MSVFFINNSRSISKFFFQLFKILEEIVGGLVIEDKENVHGVVQMDIVVENGLILFLFAKIRQKHKNTKIGFLREKKILNIGKVQDVLEGLVEDGITHVLLLLKVNELRDFKFESHLFEFWAHGFFFC